MNTLDFLAGYWTGLLVAFLIVTVPDRIKRRRAGYRVHPGGRPRPPSVIATPDNHDNRVTNPAPPRCPCLEGATCTFPYCIDEHGR